MSSGTSGAAGISVQTPSRLTRTFSVRRCLSSASAATPIDITHIMRITRPVVRARYKFAEAGTPTLGSLIEDFLLGLASRS